MAKRKSDGGKVPDVIDVATQAELLPVLVEDQAFIDQAGVAVRGFLQNAAAFFGQARAIELAAKQTLAAMEARSVPTSSKEDEDVQIAIRKANDAKKDAVAHWGITQIVHGFHGRLVAARTRATKPLEDAATIGNLLHNAWVQNDRERVRREQEAEDRRIREAQEKVRQRELEEMEAAALKAEEESAELSAREEVYVDRMLHGWTSLAATKAAGYKNIEQANVRLNLNTKVLAAIASRRKAEEIRRQAAAVKATPVESIIVSTKEVKSNVTVAAGVRGDVKRTKAEVTDADAFIRAVIEGKLGIPWSTLMINEPVLNQYARSGQARGWPGVKVVEDTKVQ